MDESDFDFEFDFLPERPAATAEDDEELLWQESSHDVPRRRAPAAQPPAQVVARRRIAAAAAVGLLLLIILIVVLTSGGGGGGGGSYATYVSDVSSVASSSQDTGTALAGLTRKNAVGKLDSLVQQTVDDIGRLQSLTPPKDLATEQTQAIVALDLRLRGLQGLRNSVSQATAATAAGTSWDAAVSTQVDDLVTSDRIWSSAVRTPANAVLQARGIGGGFPASVFVGDRTSLLKSLRTVVGSSSSATSTSGPVLSLGSKGSDVVAWQNSLNQWLKLTAPTQTQLTADGTFGASTQTVTEQLQTASGLSPDGIVGPSTRQALQAALQGKQSSSSSGSSSSGSAGTGSTNGSTGGSTSTGSVLKLGDTGQAVVDWQTQLNQWLKATAPTQTQLTTDGSFGQATQTATEQLQTAAGLTPTGQVDDATRQALTTALANAGSGRG